eukprot:1143607-Pleurochrysis_carterae.AAC.7
MPSFPAGVPRSRHRSEAAHYRASGCLSGQRARGSPRRALRAAARATAARPAYASPACRSAERSHRAPAAVLGAAHSRLPRPSREARARPGASAAAVERARRARTAAA